MAIFLKIQVTLICSNKTKPLFALSYKAGSNVCHDLCIFLTRLKMEFSFSRLHRYEDLLNLDEVPLSTQFNLKLLRSSEPLNVWTWILMKSTKPNHLTFELLCSLVYFGLSVCENSLLYPQQTFTEDFHPSENETASASIGHLWHYCNYILQKVKM